MEPPRICHEVVVHLNYPRRTGIKSVNDRCSLSQCKTARRFKVHYSTISCSLRRRTSIVIRKRSKAPKRIVNSNKFECGKTVVSYTENY